MINLNNNNADQVTVYINIILKIELVQKVVPTAVSRNNYSAIA